MTVMSNAYYNKYSMKSITSFNMKQKNDATFFYNQ